MQLFVTVLHVFLCLALILVILVQPGKGEMFGATSSSNQAYGPRGQGHFIGRATTIVAFMFMLTSITLALYSTQRMHAGSNDLEEQIKKLEDQSKTDAVVPAVPAPAVPAPDPAPSEAAPTDAPGTDVPAGSTAPATTPEGAPANP